MWDRRRKKQRTAACTYGFCYACLCGRRVGRERGRRGVCGPGQWVAL